MVLSCNRHAVEDSYVELEAPQVNMEVSGLHDGLAAASHAELPGHRQGMYVLAELLVRCQSGCRL